MPFDCVDRIHVEDVNRHVVGPKYVVKKGKTP